MFVDETWERLAADILLSLGEESNVSRPGMERMLLRHECGTDMGGGRWWNSGGETVFRLSVNSPYTPVSAYIMVLTKKVSVFFRVILKF